MKYLDGFRDPAAAAAVRKRIVAQAASLASAGRTLSIMEVCGTHTMAIARCGIRDFLPPHIRLVSGPGCPVCVTMPGYIDTAVELARRGAVIATFGDMLNVPGSSSTLARCRSEGGVVEICYSPRGAFDLARRRPAAEVVFLAIGFETTAAPVVSVIAQAAQAGVPNLSALVAFKRVPPALRALLDDAEVHLDAFLCPAHVSAILGARAYEPFAGARGVPCVVAGFEPLDILLGLQAILDQALNGEARVENQYSRVVKPEGNATAQALMARVLEPADAIWRGIGTIPLSGYRLRAPFHAFDAEARFGVTVQLGRTPPACRCGDVIKGKILPTACPLFGGRCTPDDPVGPCMVSAEGTCAAHFKYSRL